MPASQNILEVKVEIKPYGADLIIGASSEILVDQMSESSMYNERVKLRKESEAYKMIIPPLFYYAEGSFLSERSPKEEYIYEGELEQIIEFAKSDLHDAVKLMISRAISTQLDYAYS